MSLLLLILNKEWRGILLLILVGGLYYAIYTRGYDSCEAKVAAATAKANAAAIVVENDFSAENAKQLVQLKITQEKLNVIVKAQPNCNVTPAAVRLLDEDSAD